MRDLSQPNTLDWNLMIKIFIWVPNSNNICINPFLWNCLNSLVPTSLSWFQLIFNSWIFENCHSLEKWLWMSSLPKFKLDKGCLRYEKLSSLFCYRCIINNNSRAAMRQCLCHLFLFFLPLGSQVPEAAVTSVEKKIIL